MPTPSISEHLKLVGTGKYTAYNVDGITIKNVFSSVSYSQSGTVSTFSVSGVLVPNKVLDPSFQYGFTPAVSGSWSVTAGYCILDTIDGRTSQNSTWTTGDDPALGQPAYAAPFCAQVPWGSGGYFNITSAPVSAVSSAELGLSSSNIAYQASMWIATDPVDTSLHRLGPSGQVVDVTTTSIWLSIQGCNSSGVSLQNLWQGNIEWDLTDTRNYLTQSGKTYLKFTSPYIRITNPSITTLRVWIGGFNCQGVYIDDVRVRSYAYLAAGASNSGIVSNGGTLATTAGSNIVNNPEFIDNNYLSGDFNNNFRNLCPDPSFENNTWSTYNTALVSSANSGGGPRTGNAFLQVRYQTPGSGGSITLTGLSSSMVYTFGGWHADNPNTYAGTASVLKVELWNTGTLLATLVSPTISGSPMLPGGGVNYAEYTWNWSSSGYPTTNRWVLKVESLGTNFADEFWDDMELYPAISIIPPWKFLPSVTIGSSGYTLSYNEADNSFNFMGYYKQGSSDIRHLVYSRRVIYKNGAFSLTAGTPKDFCSRYFNTEHRAISSFANVNLNTTYNLSFNLLWPGAIQGVTLDMDPSIRGAFAEPFTANVPWGPTLPINGYGSLVIAVDGLSSTGALLETPLNYTIGPQQGNLPTQSLSDSRINWKYSPISLPAFNFSNPSTTQARITFKFRATNVGIETVSLVPFTAAASGTSVTTVSPSGSSTTKVYSLSNKISIDGMYQDETGAWRLLIKDGMFQRNFTMSSLEPSGSWLRSAGYNDGDNLVLIYTVPEYNLGVQWMPSDSSNILKHYQKVYRQRCLTSDPRTLILGNSNIAYITEILINGNLVVTGNTGSSGSIQSLLSQYPNIINSIDTDKGTITFVQGINDRDIVEVTYYYMSSRYIYTGYFDGSAWRDLDLNPGAGHRYNFGVDGNGQAGYTLVNNPVVVYLLPTAAYYASGDVTGNYAYNTALSLPSETRPSSFVRHTANTQVIEGQVPGYASAAIIGKIFIVPPGSINDVSVLDVRSRGGGLPEGWGEASKYTPADFTEESRVKVPVGSSSWTNTHTMLYAGDQVVVTAVGWASGSPSGSPFTISPSGSLYGTIAITTPSTGASGMYLIGNSWNALCGYSAPVTGSYTTYAPTGILFLKIINNNAGTTGEFYATIRIKRKFVEGINWDIGNWEGTPVMMNGVVVIEVPSGVLTGSNGYQRMSAAQVEEIVQKHVAAGVFAIIKYV
jgi:hypothetical protein